jgi:hypothetical protein
MLPNVAETENVYCAFAYSHKTSIQVLPVAGMQENS